MSVADWPSALPVEFNSVTRTLLLVKFAARRDLDVPVAVVLIASRPAPAVPPELASKASACTVTVPPAFVVGLTSSNAL